MNSCNRLPVCCRKIAEVKIIHPSLLFLKKNWSVSIRYYNPHYEKRTAYHPFINRLKNNEIFVEESIHTIECNTQNEADKLKKEYDKKCFYCPEYNNYF